MTTSQTHKDIKLIGMPIAMGSAQRVFGHYGTFQIGPLNCLLNKAVPFHLFDEFIRVVSTSRLANSLSI